MTRDGAIGPILRGGLIAGTLDITYAIVMAWARGGSPARMLRYIASGLLGPDVVQAGAAMSALGLLLHFCIATGWSALFVLASLRVAVLRSHPIACGLLYGLLVWAAMHYVVLPASLVRLGPGPQIGWPLVGMLAIHALGVGLPIALVTARWHRRR